MDSSKLNAKQTLVEEGTEFNGTLTSSCQVVVKGTIDGEIQAPELHIAPSGVVLGNVKAHKLRSEGVLSGSIDAVDVSLSGTVRSSTIIRASKLEAKLATEQGRLEVTFGECLLEIGEEPTLTEARERGASASSSAGSADMAARPEPGDTAGKDANGRRAVRPITELRDPQLPST